MTSSQNQDSTEGFVILIVFRPTGNLTSDSCSSSDCDFWLPNARPWPTFGLNRFGAYCRVTTLLWLPFGQGPPLLQPFNDFERKASNADKHSPRHWYLIDLMYSSSPKLSGAAFATRYRVENLKRNSPPAGVLDKSGVLMKQDLYLQKEKMLKIYMHLMTHSALILLIVIDRS